MKNLKYSNKTVMYLICAGYISLIVAGLLLHLNVMYVLAPYALLTFWGISYTQKRSVNFIKYYLGFELGVNEKGNFFQFFIFASSSNNDIHLIKDSDVKVVKVSCYQTQYILNVRKLETMLLDLKYLINLPSFGAQVVMRISEDITEDNTNICSTNYEQIIAEYHIFKNSLVNAFKQNSVNLLEANINQPVFPRKYKNRTSINSFLRGQ